MTLGLRPQTIMAASRANTNAISGCGCFCNLWPCIPLLHDWGNRPQWPVKFIMAYSKLNNGLVNHTMVRLHPEVNVKHSIGANYKIS